MKKKWTNCAIPFEKNQMKNHKKLWVKTIFKLIRNNLYNFMLCLLYIFQCTNDSIKKTKIGIYSVKRWDGFYFVRNRCKSLMGQIVRDWPKTLQMWNEFWFEAKSSILRQTSIDSGEKSNHQNSCCFVFTRTVQVRSVDVENATRAHTTLISATHSIYVKIESIYR